MSLTSRWWRVARGWGRSVTDSVRLPERWGRQQDGRPDVAEAEARAEVERAGRKEPAWPRTTDSVSSPDATEELGIEEEPSESPESVADRAFGKSPAKPAPEAQTPDAPPTRGEREAPMPSVPPARRDRETPIPPAPPAGGVSLSSHYAALELPNDSNFGEVERAYHRLKEKWDPEQYAADPVKYAKARQVDARLDEAYHTLRQALVRERRL